MNQDRTILGYQGGKTLDLSTLSNALASNPARFIWSLLDIVVVSYIIYRVLLLIRNTRAEQLLKGLLVLLIISTASRYLGLDALRWLMDKTWTLLFVALPVVFQPELRRALESLGRGTFGRGGFFQPSSDKAEEEAVAELVEATRELSRTRTGALVVFERETGLGEYLESGTALGSAVSRQLLLNIFTPNTPLHDGAVIIRQGRIERAACFLPLSDRLDVDRMLGTRHRAAIGITEVSDAVAVIVSEETGMISLTEDGQIIRRLSPENLRQLLVERVIERKSRLWRWSNERH
jgi:diadenylate cyclase